MVGIYALIEKKRRIMSMKEIGLITVDMDRAGAFTIMGIYTLDSGKKVNGMEKVHISSKTGSATKATGNMI